MKISVCMATYNGEKYIEEQIKSILIQLKENDELIISDDSSTDKTIEILEKIKDNRIKIYKGNKFRSPIFNFENALKKSSGDIIFLADQDDIWVENKVEKMLESLKKYDLVVSDCTVVNKNLEMIDESFYKYRKSRKGFFKNYISNSYLGCCMAFNRKILNKSIPFPTNIPMHDIWIGMIGEVFGETYFLKDVLVKYRRHGDNASSTGEKSKHSLLTKINWRINLLLNLIKTKMRG